MSTAEIAYLAALFGLSFAVCCLLAGIVEEYRDNLRHTFSVHRWPQSPTRVWRNLSPQPPVD